MGKDKQQVKATLDSFCYLQEKCCENQYKCPPPGTLPSELGHFASCATNGENGGNPLPCFLGYSWNEGSQAHVYNIDDDACGGEESTLGNKMMLWHDCELTLGEVFDQYSIPCTDILVEDPDSLVSVSLLW